MINHQSTALQACFAEHIYSAHMVLKRLFSVIPELFPDEEICVIDYISNKQKDKVIEIRFETATLTCAFDDNDVCCCSFVFLDNLDDLRHYVDYCNKMYPYDYIRRAWIAENNCIEIRAGKDDYFLHCFAMMPLFDKN